MQSTPRITRRELLKATAASAALVGVPTIATAEDTGHTLLSTRGCGRATGYAEANKIVTVGNKTHAAWLDSDPDGFRVRIRTLDRDTNAWSDSVTIDEAFDNHGGPALTVDSEGYLHIAYYPHHHPMRYRRSVRPNDASEWTDVTEVGSRATYPSLVCGPDDTLCLSFRESSREEPWHVDLFTLAKGASTWEGPRRILEADEMNYAHFMEAMTWHGDTLHLATRLYGGDPRTGHTIGYMQSKDGGVTWSKLDGTRIELPAMYDTLDIIEQQRGGTGVGLRAGCLAVAPDGRPFVICSTYDTMPPDAWLAFPDKSGEWQRKPFRPELPVEWAKWGVLTPGTLTFSESGRLYVALTVINPENLQDTTLWGHPSCEIVVFESDDLGETFSARILTDPDPTTPRWLPSIERPSGHNRVTGAPGLIYTDGGRGETNQALIANNVYWTDLAG